MFFFSDFKAMDFFFFAEATGIKNEQKKMRRLAVGSSGGARLLQEMHTLDDHNSIIWTNFNNNGALLDSPSCLLLGSLSIFCIGCDLEQLATFT